MIKIEVYDKTVEINEMNPAFDYRTGLGLPFIEVGAIVGDGTKIWKEMFKVGSEALAEQHVKEVIQFFNDTIQPHEKQRHFVELFQEDSELTKYKDSVGMSGWLKPDGEFVPCGFGMHSVLASTLLNDKMGDKALDLATQNQYIPMSLDEHSSYSHIGILGEVTDQQFEWFNKFFYKLSSTQRSSVKKAVESQGLKLKYEW